MACPITPRHSHKADLAPAVEDAEGAAPLVPLTPPLLAALPRINVAALPCASAGGAPPPRLPSPRTPTGQGIPAAAAPPGAPRAPPLLAGRWARGDGDDYGGSPCALRGAPRARRAGERLFAEALALALGA